MHQRLFDHKQVDLVNGLGGIGKTTLAQVYTSKHWEQYHHIAWVTQVTQDIVRDFITTEGFLHNLDIHAEGQEPQDIFIQLISVLKRIAKEPNLLIIDNADNSLTKLHDYFPSQPLWHILVTSREQIQKFDLKELSFLSENEAVDLFLSHYTLGKMTEDNIRDLVKTVDLHTLTVEILSKTAQGQRSDMDALKKAIETDSYKMHRIIVDVIKKQHPFELIGVESLIETITTTISIDHAKENPVDKFIWIPFGKSALSVFPNSFEPVIAKLQNNMALRLQDLGDYAGALKLSGKALRNFQNVLPEGHPYIQKVSDIHQSIKNQLKK